MKSYCVVWNAIHSGFINVAGVPSGHLAVVNRIIRRAS